MIRKEFLNKKYKPLKMHHKRIKKHRKHHHVRKFHASALILLITVVVTSFSTVASVFAYIRVRVDEIPTPEEILKDVSYATEFYDRDGNVRLYRLYDDESNRDKAQPKEISNIVKAAFIAAEDSNFYNHNGVDSAAIIRCTANIVAKEKKCGGSTITQQLVKIKTKKNQATLERKLDEILLATKVEEAYSKEEILSMYLNVAPFGSNITGIKTASRFYFGQPDLSKLTLAQAVTLAAIINDPVNLSPTVATDPELAKRNLEERKEYIYEQLELKLDSLNDSILKNSELDGTLISTEMLNEAKQTEVAFTAPVFNDIKAGHFVNYAIEQLQKKNYKNGAEPFTLEELQNGGYTIITSLDYNLQTIAEAHVWNAGNQYKHWNVNNAALLTMQPATGQIFAMVGSKSFTEPSSGCDGNGQNCKFNPEVNVLTSLQSPGSTNKPLAYYIAYSQSKLFPGSFLPDIPIEFGAYKPKNWDGKFYGISNAREMLRQSRNMPALQIMAAIGTDTYINVAREFGYTTYADPSTYGPSLVLGGGDVYPIEHAAAYGVFANGGDYVEPNSILQIIDRDGNTVYLANPAPKRVADPAAAFLLNQTLLWLDTGTGLNIKFDNREVSGKTGTTENNIDSFLVMYSPDFVTLGWAGNNNNDPLNQLYGWPAFVVAPWLKNYMIEATNRGYFSAKTPFPKPSDVYYGGADCNSKGCLGLKQDWLIKGREPARGDVGSRTVSESQVKTYRALTPEIQFYLDRYLRRAR